MTKFVAYYNLCPVHDPKEFLGIAEGPVESTVITTVSRNVVVVIKVSTQKQVRSWSVVEKLTAKVIYDHRSDKYVGVFSNFLRCWDENTQDVNKCKKLKFQKTIAELITLGTEQTYVLFTDGSCHELELALQTRKDQTDAAQQLDAEVAHTHTFNNAKIIKLPDERRLLAYFDRNNSTGDIELVHQYLQNPGHTLRFKLKRGDLDVSVVGYAIVDGKDAPMLLTIWSDKRMFLLSLNDSVVPEKSPGNYVSMITTLRVDSPLSVLGISENFAAIYGANSGQEGASLLLYNTQFKVIKAKQFFKVYFTFSRLWNIEENILLAMGQNLSVVSYRMSKDLLAELIGTQVNNDFKAVVESDHINEEDPLQECMLFSATSMPIESMPPSVDAISTVECVSANGKWIAYESIVDFDQTLYELSKGQLIESVVADERPDIEDVQITAIANANDNWTSTREVQAIASQLERCGASEHELTEKLLPVLIKAELLSDIVMCLQRYSNISEMMLAETLNYILTRILANSSDDETYAVLNAVLACSFDPSTIAVCISHAIGYQKVVWLLGYLYEQLTVADSVPPALLGGGHAVADQSPPAVQYEMQLLRWLGVCLDTHFQKLALSKDVQLIELLYKWHQLLGKYESEIVELDQVLSVLYNLVERRRVFKEKNFSKWYNIEEVTLF